MQLFKEQRLQQAPSLQMQQSLQVLQAPILELRGMIARELVENPVLEEAYGVRKASDEEVDSASMSSDRLSQETWDYLQNSQNDASKEEAGERHQFLLDSFSKPISLVEEVEQQVRLMPLNSEEKIIALAIAGSLDARGYVVVSNEELAAKAGVAVEVVERVLVYVQHELEPAGLAARDLKECLLLQLERIGRVDSLEWKIVSRHLDDLARKKFVLIAQALNVSSTEVECAAKVISQLDPKPGRHFDSEENILIVPEVIVERGEEGFEVRLNKEELPSVRINDCYKDMMGNSMANSCELRDYLREKLRAGRLFLKSIEQRNETILRIASVIMKKQEAFLKVGFAALQPMTMAEVAEAAGVHETTVGRAVAGKYIQTPHGVFEMRLFFTSGYSTDSGDMVSSESIRRSIQDLVKEENASNPFSDQEIAKILSERGVKVNRRWGFCLFI